MSRSKMLLVVAVLAAGCGPDEPAVMGRGTFIDVMVQLRQAELTGDTVGFPARRDEILESAGVTDSMLIEFARIRGRDATFMAAIWDSVDRVVNEVVSDEEELTPDTLELSPDTTGPS